MIEVRQLQVAHDKLQDRLLLRIATPADDEYRIWFSRRFLRELWPHLAERATRPSRPVEAGKPDAAPGSFETPFRDDKALYPLGMTPLLCSEITLGTVSDGRTSLFFKEGRERRVTVALTAELIQALCSMLRASAEQAAWDLPLDYQSPEANVSPASPPASSRLH